MVFDIKTKTVYHLLALFVTVVWGITFISTKVLLLNGLTPGSIFFYRFLMAYFIIWFFCHERFFAKTKKDEFLFLCLGLTGGSVYFLSENTALSYTLASNVSLIICTAPLITAFLSHFFVKGERLSLLLIYGSLIAIAGVALVVYNGSFNIKVNPLGDFLAIGSAFSWGLYTVLFKYLEGKYSALFITRKVFFYGLITILPSFCFSPLITNIQLLTSPIVLYNLLFLGIIASMLCYCLWNIAVKNLGAIKTTNYIYLTPCITVTASFFILKENISALAAAGIILIITGVYLAEKKR